MKNKLVMLYQKFQEKNKFFKTITTIALLSIFYFTLWAGIVTKSNNNNLFVTVVAAQGGGHNVILAWSASLTPNVTYTVYRNTVPGACFVGSKIVIGVTGLTYTDSSVVAGTTYYYAVSAVGTGNQGESKTCSNEVTAVIPPAPNPPSSLTVTVN